MSYSFICNESSMGWLAATFARTVATGQCIALHGDLGAGKSTFARAFIHALCGEEVTVASPSFTISQSYLTKHGVLLWHYDLYRLKHPQELYEIGLEETLMHAITLIEWSEIANFLLPHDTLHITFAFHENPDYRNVTMSSVHAGE